MIFRNIHIGYLALSLFFLFNLVWAALFQSILGVGGHEGFKVYYLNTEPVMFYLVTSLYVVALIGTFYRSLAFLDSNKKYYEYESKLNKKSTCKNNSLTRQG